MRLLWGPPGSDSRRTRATSTNTQTMATAKLQMLSKEPFVIYCIGRAAGSFPLVLGRWSQMRSCVGSISGLIHTTQLQEQE